MHFNSLIPELNVSDFEKSFAFYTQILGFHVEYRRDEDKFAFLSLQQNQLMIEQISTSWQTGPLEYPFGRGMNLSIEVDSLAVLLQSLRNHQYPLFREPKENWRRKDQTLLGDREFLVLDPDGFLLRFTQPLGERPVS